MAYEKGIFSKYDEEKISLAIKSLEYTLTDGIELAKVIYTTAFSMTFALSGTPKELLDEIYNGSERESNIAAHTAEAVTEQPIDIAKTVVSLPCTPITGDLLLLQQGEEDNGRIYIYDDGVLFELTKPYMTRHKADTILDDLDKYTRCALIRPSLEFVTDRSDAPLTDIQNERQRTVVETAISYLLRGYRMQYDDTNVSANVFRWQTAKKSPEDYTSEMWGYSNCAAFAIDAHRYSWGYKTDNYCTRQLCHENPNVVYEYYPTGKETEEEKARVKAEFFAALQCADIINVRYLTSGGHAMVYVGNGNIIHSAGKNYSYDEQYPFETYEPTVRIMRANDLFDVNHKRYVFSKLSSLKIVRPLNEFDGEIPEQTKNRQKNLGGIVAEKLSSKKKFNTVDRGEEITYTVSIFNTNDYAVTLDVKDKAPLYTTGEDISARLTVQPRERKSVSYTVRVNDDAPYGEPIYGEDTTIGGVIHRCPPVYIGKALTSEDAQYIISASDEILSKDMSDIECVNEIYEHIGHKKVLPFASISEISADLFDIVGEKEQYEMKSSSYCKNMLVPCYCYSGHRIIHPTRFEEDIARMVRPEYLMTGDIIISAKSTESNIYLCAGEKILNLTKKEYVKDTAKFTETLLATKEYFAVLRPSLIM